MIPRSKTVASLILVVLAFCFCKITSSQNNNEFPNVPCPSIFQYARSENKNIGLITVPNVKNGKTTVEIELSQPGSTIMNNIGQLSLNFNKDNVFEYINEGRPFIYRVDFPLQNVIPGVTAIRVNGLQICSGQPYNSPSTAMKLEHTLNAFSTSSSSGDEPFQNYQAKKSSWPKFTQNSFDPSTHYQHSHPPPLSFDNSPSHYYSQANPSYFNQPSFDPSPPYQHSYANPSSFSQPSFDPSPPYQHSHADPSYFNQPSFSPTARYSYSQIQPSSFNQPSFNPSPPYQQSNPQPLSFNQPSFNSYQTDQQSNFYPSSFMQPSFGPSQTYQPINAQIPPFVRFSQPSIFNPTTFNPMPSYKPSNVQPSSFNQPSFDSTPIYQPSSTQPTAFNRASFNPAQAYKPSNNQQRSIDRPTTKIPLNFESFLQPPFQPQSYKPPSMDTFKSPSPNEPELNHKTFAQHINNQPGLAFKTNAENPFFKSSGVDKNFTLPSTNESVSLTPSPSLDLNIRNVEPSSSPKSDSIDHATFEYINSVCGRENKIVDMKKLNVKGEVIARARFPWIVAVFRKINTDYNFKCGGSLISTRTVVSAAHCFYLGFEIMKPDEVMVSMGRHNLTESLDAFNIDVEKIIQHPDYNPTLINFDADLAIVRLKQSVLFTTSIRPICMWQGNIDAREIEGVSGAIVGWGSDGRRNTTTIPTLVNATVVSELTCLRSNDQFISLTSNRTICAGNLDGSGPCMGDSGNGLMIRNRNKWMLRGTVSAVLGTPIRPCILDQYAIYSDIAMFIEWIRFNMLL